MKSLFSSLLSALLLFTAGLSFFSTHALAQTAGSDSYVDGVVLVQFTPEGKQALTLQKSGDIQQTGIQELDKINADFGVQSIEPLFKTDPRFAERHRSHGLDRWYRVRLADKSVNPQLMAALENTSVIRKAEREAQHKLVDTFERREATAGLIHALNSDDPMILEQWHYNNTGQTGGMPGADINLFGAWEKETGSGDVVVIVLDTGIDVDHPDLSESLWVNPNSGADNGYEGDVHGWNFVANNANINDVDGHGSHTSGTIAARSDNGVGVAGIAGGNDGAAGVKIMVARTFAGPGNTAGGFAEAFVYGADNGAVIASNSWGGGGYSQALNDAMDYFEEYAGFNEAGEAVGPIHGGLIVFAAGNYGSNYPSEPIASNDDVVAVASTNDMDNKSGFSEYGEWIDLSAPGSNVVSTIPDGSYAVFSGTSMAAPHVSGVAALIASYTPGLTADAILEQMKLTGDNIDELNPGYEGMLGVRVDAGQALQEDDGIPPSDVTDLAVAGASTQNSVKLTWTAPGGSGDEGQAYEYDLRYSTDMITAENFEDAEDFEIAAPGVAGSEEIVSVKGLDPQTQYYFALKASDLFGSTSGLSNVVSATTDGAPAITLSATQVSAEVEIGETTTKTLTVTNTGEGTLNFALPAFLNDEVMTSDALAPLARVWDIQEGLFPQTVEEAMIIRDVLSGQNINPDASAVALVDQYETQVQVGARAASMDEVASNKSQSPVIEFENLQAYGGEFYNVTGEGFQGMLEGVNPDFMIMESGPATWASDFAIFFTLSEDEEYEVMLQVGGFGSHEDAYQWHEGQSGDPGTSVTTPVILDEPLDLEGLEVWIGNGWFGGQGGTWSGQLELMGANSQPSFISSITPSSASLEAGESIDLEVVFDATDVVAGVYTTTTDITSNDLDNSEIELEFLMQTAGGEVAMVSSSDMLDFGSLFEGQSSVMDLLFTNLGTAIAEVSGVSIEGEMFSLEDLNEGSGEYLLAPGESLAYLVAFEPTTTGSFEGSVTLSVADSAAVSVPIMGTATDVPSISLDPDVVEMTLPGGATGTASFLIVNNGNGPLNFTIPGYDDTDGFLTSESYSGAKRTIDAELTPDMLQQRLDRELIRRSLSGELASLTPAQQAVLNRYHELQSSSSVVTNSGRNEGGDNSEGGDDGDGEDGDGEDGDGESYLEPNGNVIEFQNLTAGGFEFYQVGDADFTGVLEAVTADFVLVEGDGGSTWANDLTLLVTTSDEIFDESTFVLQVGGSTNFIGHSNYYQWGMGHTGTPGTVVQTTVAIDNPIDTDELYFFIGNGWGYGDSGTWSGSITLEGVNGYPDFVSSMTPSFGTVEAGESVEVSTMFDANDMLGGTYTTDIEILSNVPDMPVATLTAILNVEGTVSIDVDPEFIDFGNVSAGQTTFRFLEIENQGNGVLEIESVTTEGEGFSNGDFPVSIEPFDSELMKVFFSSPTEGSYTGTLTITSSDETMPTLEVPLSAVAVGNAEIEVTPIPVFAEIEAGTTGTASFTIQNNGGGALNFIFPGYADDLFSGVSTLPIKADSDMIHVTNTKSYFSISDREIVEEYLTLGTEQMDSDAQSVIDRYESIYASNETPFYGGGGGNGDGDEGDDPDNGEDDNPGNGEVEVEGQTLSFGYFAAESFQFMPVSNAPFSGLIHSVQANFEILESTGQTWANDLTLLFTTSPDELTEDSIILQVGGTHTIGNPEAHCQWATGNSGSVGAGVEEVLQLTSEFIFEEIYIWIGHGWSNGHGAWSGEITLLDLTGEEGPNPPEPPSSIILGINPPVGFIAGGESLDITATIDATGLEAGFFYEESVILLSTDSENPLFEIPFVITITGGPVEPPVEPTTDFSLTILAADQAGNDIPLTIGTAADATLDYDPDYDLLAPPPPPDGAFDARLITNDVSFFISFIPTVTDMNEWEIQFVASNGNDPIVLTWDPAELPEEGSFTLTDTFGQGFVNVNMRETNSFSLADASVPGLDALKITQSAQMTMMFSYMDNWNMMSMPMYVNMDGYDSYYDMFPDGIVGSMYGFDGSYNAATEMTMGMGYWMAFTQAGSVPMTGEPMMSADIPLMEGWNMIGSVTYMGEINDPSNIVLNGTLYGFDGSYYTTTELEPGQGYWVASSAAGAVSLSVKAGENAGLSASSELEIVQPESSNRVTFQTENTPLQILHFGAEIQSDWHPYQLMLPPQPPAGSFDARLADSRRVTDSAIADIELMQDGRTLSAVVDLLDGGSALVSFTNGQLVLEEKIVESGQSVTVPAEATTMQVTPEDQIAEELPSEFALGQNYPNPFNPSTTIQFALPADSDVRLDVYNVAGQHVATLADGQRQAGVYEVTFDASGLASGLYLYRLTAGGFSETKQLTLIK